jgi:hypothetical protein
VTIVAPTGAGFLTLYAGDQALPPEDVPPTGGGTEGGSTAGDDTTGDDGGAGTTVPDTADE